MIAFILDYFQHMTAVKFYALAMIALAFIIRYFVGSIRYNNAGRPMGYNRALSISLLIFLFRWAANFLIAFGCFLLIIEWFNSAITV